MRTFKISFKLYHHELSDWASEYIHAKSPKAALHKFARQHKIQDADSHQPESWRWWNDDWYSAFHLIEEAKRKPCLRVNCQGNGSVTLV